MTAKGPLLLIEKHIEKGIVAVAAVFLLAVLWLYGVGSPNKVEFRGQKLGPGALDEEVLAAAKQLEASMRAARPEEVTVEDYSKRLEKQFSEGLFAQPTPPPPTANAAPVVPPPPLKPELRVTTSFGKPIEVPGLEETEDVSGSLALVTPLKPMDVKLRTGRSLAIRKPTKLTVSSATAAPAAPPKEGETAEAVEIPWVTVAAYFDKKAQYNEMIKAGYAPFRSKVYVAGTDVERQEKLSTGEWSEWKPVENSTAMPDFSVPSAVIDATGSLINKHELDDVFNQIVKPQQDRLMQPPFFTVEKGAEWAMPALPGFEEEEEADDERPRARPTRPKPPEMVRGGGRFGGRGGAIGGRGGGRSPSGGGMSPEGGGRGVPWGPQGDSPAKQKEENRKRAKEDLAQAKELFGKKEYSAARGMADQVVNNADASDGDKAQATRLIEDCDKKLQSEGPSLLGGPRGVRGGPGIMSEGIAPMSGRFAGAGGPGPGAQQNAIQLVSHPENGWPAVWFHDDSVTAGKTYRYRMRVNLWNRYVGRMKALKDPEQAKNAIIHGEWSLPSDAIVVAPQTHFFVTGPKFGTSNAMVDVWKWRQGKWLREKFEVGIGDAIGGLQQKVEIPGEEVDGKPKKEDVDFSTKAIVLDLRPAEKVMQRQPAKGGGYSLREVDSLVLVYLDPVDGQVKERVAVFDRSDPVKKKLEAQEKS